MAYGVVPVAGAISSIPQIIAETGAGVSPPAEDIDAFTEAIARYGTDADSWKAASVAARESAPLFTYRRYLEDVRQLFNDAWGTELPELPEALDMDA